MAKKHIKWFRVAREGGTIDGRELLADELQSMADNYDPEIYGARINKEHMRGIFFEDQFGAFGDVLGLKTEKDKTDKLCLCALIDPTDDLIELNQRRQKVYTSIEMRKLKEFKGWYLGGLAVTDSPASTGTSMLKFSAQPDQTVTFNLKDIEGKNHAVNFKTTAGDWSDHFETEMNFMSDSNQDPDTKPTLLSQVKNLLSKKQQTDDAQYADIQQAVTQIAEAQSQHAATLEQYIAKLPTNPEQQFAAKSAAEELRNKLDQLTTNFNDLKQTLSGTSDTPPRPEHTDSGAQLTDC